MSVYSYKDGSWPLLLTCGPIRCRRTSKGSSTLGRGWWPLDFLAVTPYINDGKMTENLSKETTMLGLIITTVVLLGIVTIVKTICSTCIQSQKLDHDHAIALARENADRQTAGGR